MENRVKKCVPKVPVYHYLGLEFYSVKRPIPARIKPIAPNGQIKAPIITKKPPILIRAFSSSPPNLLIPIPSRINPTIPKTTEPISEWKNVAISFGLSSVGIKAIEYTKRVVINPCIKTS